jgi:hypothetical protein
MLAQSPLCWPFRTATLFTAVSCDSKRATPLTIDFELFEVELIHIRILLREYGSLGIASEIKERRGVLKTELLQPMLQLTQLI